MSIETLQRFTDIVSHGIGSVLGKRTDQCFIEPWLKNRDRADYLRFLPKTQPRTPSFRITGISVNATADPVHSWDEDEVSPLKDMIAKFLGITGVTTEELGMIILKRGYTFSLPQIETLMGEARAGKRSILLPDIGGTCFVATENEVNPVAVCTFGPSAVEPYCWAVVTSKFQPFLKIGDTFRLLLCNFHPQRD